MTYFRFVLEIRLTINQADLSQPDLEMFLTQRGSDLSLY